MVITDRVVLMEIVASKSGTTLVVTMHGRLNAASTEALQEQLLAHVDAGEKAILLDLAGVDYISSAGLRTLLIATKRMQANDGRLAICSLTDNVREVFRMSGFDSIIEVHPDLATAFQKLA